MKENKNFGFLGAIGSVLGKFGGKILVATASWIALKTVLKKLYQVNRKMKGIEKLKDAKSKAEYNQMKAEAIALRKQSQNLIIKARTEAREMKDKIKAGKLSEADIRKKVEERWEQVEDTIDDKEFSDLSNQINNFSIIKNDSDLLNNFSNIESNIELFGSIDNSEIESISSKLTEKCTSFGERRVASNIINKLKNFSEENAMNNFDDLVNFGDDMDFDEEIKTTEVEDDNGDTSEVTEETDTENNETPATADFADMDFDEEVVVEDDTEAPVEGEEPIHDSVEEVIENFGFIGKQKDKVIDLAKKAWEAAKHDKTRAIQIIKNHKLGAAITAAAIAALSTVAVVGAYKKGKKAGKEEKTFGDDMDFCDFCDPDGNGVDPEGTEGEFSWAGRKWRKLTGTQTRGEKVREWGGRQWSAIKSWFNKYGTKTGAMIKARPDMAVAAGMTVASAVSTAALVNKYHRAKEEFEAASTPEEKMAAQSKMRNVKVTAVTLYGATAASYIVYIAKSLKKGSWYQFSSFDDYMKKQVEAGKKLVEDMNKLKSEGKLPPSMVPDNESAKKKISWAHRLLDKFNGDKAKAINWVKTHKKGAAAIAAIAIITVSYASYRLIKSRKNKKEAEKKFFSALDDYLDTYNFSDDFDDYNFADITDVKGEIPEASEDDQAPTTEAQANQHCEEIKDSEKIIGEGKLVQFSKCLREFSMNPTKSMRNKVLSMFAEAMAEAADQKIEADVNGDAINTKDEVSDPEGDGAEYFFSEDDDEYDFSDLMNFGDDEICPECGKSPCECKKSEDAEVEKFFSDLEKEFSEDEKKDEAKTEDKPEDKPEDKTEDKKDEAKAEDKPEEKKEESKEEAKSEEKKDDEKKDDKTEDESKVEKSEEKKDDEDLVVKKDEITNFSRSTADSSYGEYLKKLYRK